MVCGGISRKRELSKMIGKSIPGKREFPDCITGNRETEKWYVEGNDSISGKRELPEIMG